LIGVFLLALRLEVVGGVGSIIAKKIKLSCSDGFDGFVAVVAQFGKTLLETNTGKKSRPLI
jgi:hypothetical protein